MVCTVCWLKRQSCWHVYTYYPSSSRVTLFRIFLSDVASHSESLRQTLFPLGDEELIKICEIYLTNNNNRSMTFKQFEEFFHFLKNNKLGQDKFKG